MTLMTMMNMTNMINMARGGTESERAKLTSFVPKLHTHNYRAQVTAQSDSHCWYPFSLSSFNQILTEVELSAGRNKTWTPWRIGAAGRIDAEPMDKDQAGGGEIGVPLHISHLKHGHGLALVRTRATRSRYQTWRAGILPCAMV